MNEIMDLLCPQPKKQFASKEEVVEYAKQNRTPTIGLGVQRKRK